MIFGLLGSATLFLGLAPLSLFATDYSADQSFESSGISTSLFMSGSHSLSVSIEKQREDGLQTNLSSVPSNTLLWNWKEGNSSLEMSTIDFPTSRVMSRQSKSAADDKTSETLTVIKLSNQSKSTGDDKITESSSAIKIPKRLNVVNKDEDRVSYKKVYLTEGYEL